jgi:glycosyltransferase involved in cell wall biosynthesis
MLVNSKSNPFVSVIIPVHNGEKFISSTIESVLSQSYSNFELIIVNDGSLDSTQEIISEYQKKDNRISVVHQVKSGVSIARNVGINLAKGKYISFLDADDIWLNENLAVKINFLELNSLAFGITSFCEVINEFNQPSIEVKKGDENIILRDILLWKGNYITIPSGIVFQTDLLKNHGGFNVDLSNNADQEIVMRYLGKGFSFHTLPMVTWHYRQHANNMSSNVDLMERDTVKCYQLASRQGYFQSAFFKNKCRSRMALILAFSFWKNGNNRTKSIKWMIKSFAFSPVNFTGQVLDKLLLSSFKNLKRNH